jgi:post-segregation antitoxin (ccd killing protein)
MGKAERRIVEVDAELLKLADDAHLSISQVLEQALAARLRATGVEERAREWAAENSDAIKDHEQRIAQYGVFGDDLRTW